MTKDEQKPKKPKKPKKERKSPGTKGKGKAAAYHPSEERKKATKKQIRGELGTFLGKRQIRMKIDYNFEWQKYQLEMKSGDGTIDETLECGGIPRLLYTLEKTIKKWRGQLV